MRRVDFERPLAHFLEWYILFAFKKALVLFLWKAAGLQKQYLGK